MRENLVQIADGKHDDRFAITYSDMHGLWGGVTVKLSGTGHYEQTQREPGGEPQQVVGHVNAEAVVRVAQVLLGVEAWEQRIPERAPVAGESRATVTIFFGDQMSAVWERHNDLATNQRLILVRDYLVKLGDALSP